VIHFFILNVMRMSVNDDVVGKKKTVLVSGDPFKSIKRTFLFAFNSLSQKKMYWVLCAL